MASPQQQPHSLPSLSDIHEFFIQNHFLWCPDLDSFPSSPVQPSPPSPREYKVLELPPYAPSFVPSSSYFEYETRTIELATGAPLPPNQGSTFGSEDPNPQYPQFNYDRLHPFGDATAYYDGYQIAEFASIAAPPPPAPAAAEGIEVGCVAFECRICLKMAKQPVVTACGHLFCWPCLYKWMWHSRKIIKECPSCRDEINEDVIIPILGSNDEEQVEADIPRRPRSKRTC